MPNPSFWERTKAPGGYYDQTMSLGPIAPLAAHFGSPSHLAMAGAGAGVGAATGGVLAHLAQKKKRVALEAMADAVSRNRSWKDRLPFMGRESKNTINMLRSHAKSGYSGKLTGAAAILGAIAGAGLMHNIGNTVRTAHAAQQHVNKTASCVKSFSKEAGLLQTTGELIAGGVRKIAPKTATVLNTAVSEVPGAIKAFNVAKPLVSATPVAKSIGSSLSLPRAPIGGSTGAFAGSRGAFSSVSRY